MGSFANATIWRLHEQSKLIKSKKQKIKSLDLSISKGRSMCPNCKHQLSARELIPVFSWLSLGGKCRYCHKAISKQYPLVELITGLLFITSYVFWPFSLVSTVSWMVFAIWLACLTCFVILAVYDAKWMILPNRVVFILIGLATVSMLLQASIVDYKVSYCIDVLMSLILTAGLFGILYSISSGKWIGFGDVKLAIALGLLMATAPQALMLLFTASFLGSLFAMPGLITGRLKRTTLIPFGPFLMAATIVVYLFGQSITMWLKTHLFLS